MKNFLAAVVLASFAFIIAGTAYAKRAAPAEVASVQKDGVEYSAPHDKEGFVVATWKETKMKIWSRQIYVVKYEHKQGLEGDVQTCFITNLEIKGGKLIIKNERDSEFELDLSTLDVKVLKGQPVVDFSDRK